MSINATQENLLSVIPELPYPLFFTLDNSYFTMGNSQNPFKKERLFLDRLCHRLAFQKSYEPKSNPSLTLERFKAVTPFSRMDILNLVKPNDFYYVDFFFKAGNCSKLAPQVGGAWKEEAVEEAAKDLYQLMKKWEIWDCRKVTKLITKYHGFFTKLVPAAEFKECFSQDELNAIRRYYEGRTHFYPCALKAGSLAKEQISKLGLLG